MGSGPDRWCGRRRHCGAVCRCRSQKAQGRACGTQNCCQLEGERRVGKTTHEIASDIDQTRSDLKSNLEELETRVKDATDWRAHFRKRPGSMIAAALFGGVLLSLMSEKRSP